MKNIFDFATKELSQDAFLRWLFENYNCKDKSIRDASNKLIMEMLNSKIVLNSKNNEKYTITAVNTKAQEKNTDILVSFKINNKLYLIIIEDKIYSIMHDNQLEKYKNYIKNENDYKIYEKVFIYYKTNILTKDELDYFSKENEWKIFDIKKIYEIFKSVDTEGINYLLNDYINYIKKSKEEYLGNLPNNIKSWTYRHWHNFCTSKLKTPQNVDTKYGVYRNHYFYLQFNIKNYWNKYAFGEIRSRDINDFKFRILLYDVEEKYINKDIKNWRDNIKKNNQFKLQNYKKQIAINSKKESASTMEELKNLIEKYIDEYIKIVK